MSGKLRVLEGLVFHVISRFKNVLFLYFKNFLSNDEEFFIKKSLSVETQAFFFFFVKSQIAGVHQFHDFIIDVFQCLSQIFKLNQFVGWVFDIVHMNF